MADDGKKTEETQQQETRENEAQQKDSQETKEVRTYTDEEVNKIVAQHKGSEAAKVLKELGVDSVEKGKAALEQLKDWQKQQMTEAERLKAEKEEATSKLTEYQKKALESETKFAALKLGVDEKYLTDVIKLLPEGEDSVEDRLKAFLNERPVYLKKGTGDIGAKTEQKTTTEQEDVAARVRRSMGLK